MADFEESLEELQEKIGQYIIQRDAVNEALKENQGQENLLQLHADLCEVINLTQDLINYKTSNETNDLHFLNEPSLLLEGFEDTNISNDASKPTNLNNINQESSFIQASSKNEYRGLQLNQFIGRTCQATYHGKPYYAEIISIQDDKKLGVSALVEFIGYGNQQLCPLSTIQILVPPSMSLCKPGARIQAIYSEDGKWYNCLIDEQTSKGFQVTFTDYGNTEEIPFDRIRFSTSQAKEATKSRIKEIVTPGGYRIPEYLTAKPNDSDTQKLHKKKKIQSLKKKQKSEQINEDAQNRAITWRKFNNKATNKKISGFISGRGYQSIFKSNDQPSTNSISSSNKFQASAFVPRRKHDAEDILEG